MNIATLARALFVSGVLFLSTPTIAVAYGGPGSVISGFGALVAVLAAVVAAIIGFIWYPVKKLLRSASRQRRSTDGGLEGPDDASA